MYLSYSMMCEIGAREKPPDLSHSKFSEYIVMHARGINHFHYGFPNLLYHVLGSATLEEESMIQRPFLVLPRFLRCS